VNATILNVDDNAANRYVKSRVLRAAGFDVVDTDTGTGALQLVAERQPDLVLLDIRLPDISGIEVCRRLREDPQTRGIPIIHISATHVTPADAAISRGAGADIYLAEPVGPQELSSAVRTLLRLRTTEQGLAATEERLRLATQAAGVATWDIDLRSGTAIWSPEFNAMLGLDGAAGAVPATFDTWLSRVHADDRVTLASAFRRSSAEGSDLALEHRIAAPGGEPRWIAAYGKVHGDGSLRRLIGVATDVTARRRSEAERETLLARTQEAQRAAEQALGMQDEFLAMLSHELRTPMSAVLGWLQVLKMDTLSAAQQAKAVETIERNARVQTQLVNDLLDVSRIVTGKMELEGAAMSLDRALESAIDSARFAADTGGVTLEVRMDRGPWVVRGNPERVQQIFSNLLSNAIKFSPRGGRIEARLERAGASAVVTVSDQGEGIPANVLPHIFDRFRQADSSVRRRHGGLGLGLAIVKSLVDLHGGQIEAASAGLGKGSSFRVTLPLLADTEAPAPSDAEPGRADLNGIRVLVVDDDESNLQMISQVLRLHGATVMEASSSAAALEIAGSWGPQALILDIGMPGKDGYELLSDLRGAVGTGPDALPAVALTGFATREDVQRALEKGFQAHVAKPFDVEGLCHLIGKLAQRSPRKEIR
jgi:signal transduction histidine kinase